MHMFKNDQIIFQYSKMSNIMLPINRTTSRLRSTSRSTCASIRSGQASGVLLHVDTMSDLLPFDCTGKTFDRMNKTMRVKL